MQESQNFFPLSPRFVTNKAGCEEQQESKEKREKREVLRFIFCIHNKQSFLNTYLLRLWRCFALVSKTGSNTLTRRVLTSCFEDLKTSNLRFAVSVAITPTAFHPGETTQMTLHGCIALLHFGFGCRRFASLTHYSKSLMAFVFFQKHPNKRSLTHRIFKLLSRMRLIFNARGLYFRR